MIDYRHILNQKIVTLKQSGSYRYFLDVNKSAQHFPRFYFETANGEKKQAVNWCSNDYMCMSVNEAVISKLSYVAHKSGSGSGGTRNISGTTNYHRELENTIAALHNKDSALLFGGAYLANLTALGTLGKLFSDAVFISDEENHASIIEGIRSTGCEKLIFKHNDLHDLESVLKSLPVLQPKILVFESVYSISGTIAPVKEIMALAKKYNCLTYVDEVHAVGLYGEDGAGVLASHGLQQHIDIINGTLAKGFGVIGGYIAADKVITDAIRSFGSGFIFTTSLPPAICAAATKSIQLLQANPDSRKKFHENIFLFREILLENRIPFNNNPSHITPVPVGDATICKKIADRLLHEYGIYLQPVNYPTVKRGEACLRITVTIKHTEADMHYLAAGLKKVMKEELNFSFINKIQHSVFG